MGSDPYFEIDLCVARLLREYDLHGKLIVAVDFDDTVFDFHGEGHIYPEILDVLRKCQRRNFYIVLFTGTAPDRWGEQEAYLREKGILISAINKNPIPLPFGNDGKMYYNILLDDRAGLFEAWRILDIVLERIKTGARD